MVKRVLVTGSSGTIGTRLCERLESDGIDYVGIDIKPNKWNSKVDAKTAKLDLRLQGTSRERKSTLLNGVVGKDFDTIIHLAANARVNDLVKEPWRAFGNFAMMQPPLELARQIAKRGKQIGFIFASSREVYGNSNQPVHCEEDVHLELCESPYTGSKVGGEAMVQAYGECYGIKRVNLRFSNVYGMYDESNRFMPLMYRLARDNKRMPIFGENKLLDFTYIDDTVNGIMLAIHNLKSIDGETINIAYGEGTKLVDVAEMIKEELNSSSEIVFEKPKVGEVVQYIADISKAKIILGYEPTIDVKEGVRRSVEWCRANLE